MANHKSSLKRIRSNETKRIVNRYQHRTTRNAIKKLRELTDKTEAETLYVSVVSMLDKLAKKNVIHANKAANLKSGLAKHIAALLEKHLMYINRTLKYSEVHLCFIYLTILVYKH